MLDQTPKKAIIWKVYSRRKKIGPEGMKAETKIKYCYRHIYFITEEKRDTLACDILFRENIKTNRNEH